MKREKAGPGSRDFAATREFLYYWVPKEIDEHLDEGLKLDSAVSAQFHRISVGSRLWIVTCRSGRLHLAGPIQVARIMTPQQAKKERGWEIPRGRLCAVPPRGMSAPCRNMAIDDLAADLRFESASSPRLQVLSGKVNPQQLQTIRQLTPESAALLERRWTGPTAPEAREEALNRDDPESARSVIERLVGSKAARRAFCEVLARSIRIAHDSSHDCWSITLFRSAVRLNVGQIEVIHLTGDGLKFVVDAGALSAESRRRLGRHVTNPSDVYPSVPVRKSMCWIPNDRIAELAPLSAGALESLIREAGSRKLRSPFHASFSEGVVRFVEKELEEKLPRPGSERIEATTGPALHITIAASEEREKLEKASRRKSEVTWTLPMKARKGDLVLFHLAGTGLMAKGRVSTPPRTNGKGRRAFGNKRFGDIGAIAVFERPVPIDLLREALPDFGWPRYPMSLTTVPQEICPRLLALVDSGHSAEIQEVGPARGGGTAKPGGQGFGSPEENRAIEEAAVAFVVRKYESSGWRVTSRESERVGYDLECTRRRDVLHLEVKGLSGEEWSFMATAGELRKAEEDPDFRLAAVRRANTSDPEMRQWTGSELRSSFDREPVAYRLRLKRG